MPILIVLLSVVVFCAMILNLAAKPRVTQGLIGACTFLAAVGGLILYGIGFAASLEDPVLMVIRTVIAVSRMFAGVNDFGAVSAAPIFSYRINVVIFWILHLMAFYATASATISTLGAAALKRLKFWLQRYGETVIIYGVNGDSVEFGRGLIAGGARNVVFVAGKPDAALESAINAAGGLLRSDISALNPDSRFLKSIGADQGEPVLRLYALDADEAQNLAYAWKLLSALEKADADTSNIRLVMRSTDDSVECGLSRTADRFGYGDVRSFTDVSLTARMLMQAMPPWEKMTFHSDGTAKGDFDSVIVGFGRTGQSVLRHLVRNAQFEGSHFSAAIFSQGTESENGYFCSSFPGLVDNYDISFHTASAQSKAFYAWLRDHASELRYVVICTGQDARDTEIRTEVSAFLTLMGCDAAVCCCSDRSVSWCSRPGDPLQCRSAFTPEAIASDALDRMAMMLNYSYVNDPDVTPEKAWAECDYFGRESSRASADFIRAFLRITKQKEEDLLPDSWNTLPRELLENLGKTEHLRWCAFHYSMGFTAMSRDSICHRGEIYRSQAEANGKATIRIGKDLTARQHACLCSWEELPALAELEQTFTGTVKDYQDMDIRNVLELPAVLRASKER